MTSSPPPFFEEDPALRHHAYSRKQKSLGLLCTNFINLYNKDGVDTVGLDEAASRLGVERRRIYDIVNVLESVGVLSRKAKNRYSWIGFAGIPKMLEDLKEEALRDISNNPGGNPFAYYKFVEDDDDDKSQDQDVDVREDASVSTMKASSSGGAPLKSKPGSENRREKSLGQLTQNFVKLFLTSEVDTISLDEAAKLLLCDGHESNQMRTKVRRLYDIANVLSSINLIEKTQHSISRKPAFKWLGVNGKRSSSSIITMITGPPALKQCNKRSFGTDLTNALCKRPKLSMAVQKPRDPVGRSDVIRECNLTAQRQLQGSKAFSFGPFQPSGEMKGQRGAEDREESSIQDWETLASSFRIQYHNQALSELFSHYVEAWKSWYIEVAQGGNTLASHHTTAEPGFE